MNQIPFNQPAYTGSEDKFVLEAMRSSKISGDGKFSQLCHQWFNKNLGCVKSFLTPSCTQALEMAALLINIQPGDEVIMPSYTFVSTANAFALRGAKIVFVDIRPDTMNIDETLIEAAITPKTMAIVPVHYAGVACEMDAIMQIAENHNLFVIEDAAQGMLSTYKGKPLGTLGHLGAYSFHETKNFTSGGEGGLLIINDERFVKKAEIIREKGTNRNQYFRGMVDKYTWMDLGSSYLPSELQAAYLWGQLEESEIIHMARLKLWKKYNERLQSIAKNGQIGLPVIPQDCTHNAHIYYIKVPDMNLRTKLINFLLEVNVMAVFHYVPLHASIAGKKFGAFSGIDVYTTSESERLLRLPMYYSLKDAEVDYICNQIVRYLANTV